MAKLTALLQLFVLALLVAAFTGSASAIPITYVFTGTATGEMFNGESSQSFTDASLTVTATGDTGDVFLSDGGTTCPSTTPGAYIDNKVSTTIAIAGGGIDGTITATVVPVGSNCEYVFVRQSTQTVGYGVTGITPLCCDIINFTNAAYATYDLKSSIGPISSPSDTAITIWQNVPTDQGSLTVTSYTNNTFTASTITQTQTLGGPGTTTTFTFNTDTFKFTPLNNAGGEQLTVTPVLVPQSSFSAGSLFPHETCVPYADYSAAVDTCVLFHVVCSGADCSTIQYQLATGYDLPPDLVALGGIGGPDFLKASNQPCPPPDNFFDQSIFLSYIESLKDPTTKGGSRTPSCFVATYNPNATPVSNASVNSYFVGFFPPIDNTPTLNTAKAGSTIPIIWQLFDASNNPITPSNLGLTYCTGTGCGLNTVTIQFVPVACGSVPATASDPVVSTAGSSGLQFNSSNNTWQFNVKTPKSFQNTCQLLEVAFPTGTTQPGPVHTALFSFK